ncbi:tripartite tricarboxylate transporter substrate binding protein [Methylocella sp. CPCC 101449]|uniref:Bug family tripartite tricarboxylate transporter substrate binding protein n=1 Tax=Methylocella sp. CPCC 101449 TaxID=2987531 RepID=UPI00288FD540|nr:tripartite tricarboxylate transporter substrate binding protein [Methylocella sp. CPCC 101449]MDT2023814.1 tripartite tricarboxylate transporter substrate binding protein [Methylocella sp. CPCC 101449]HEV2573644.1 tripartite tricarboxylate transporter substrate binding protein [Beijerinckiaceae bacterium]
MMLPKIAAAAFWLAGAMAVAAQSPLEQIPPGPITVIVPLAPGGPADAIARVLAERLSQDIKRSIVIENRTGAAGNVGAAFVAKSAPDGLTWLFCPDSIVTVNPNVYKSQGFDATRDLVPVAKVGQNLLLLAVNAKTVPAKSFKELVEYGKSHELNFGSAGIGSPGHLALEYLKMVSELRAVHVPYRGAALALQDLLAGNIQASFITAGVLIPHVNSGALRALAVSANERVRFVPDIPTAEEAGIKGFEARFVNYMFAPGGMKPELRAAFGNAVLEALKNPEVRARIEQQATDPIGADEAASVAQIARDRQKWGEVIAKAGMKME